MSISCSKSYKADCDGAGCIKSTEASLNMKDLVKEMTELGWVKINKRTYCPECQAKNPPRKRGRKPKVKEEEVETTGLWEEPWTPPKDE